MRCDGFFIQVLYTVREFTSYTSTGAITSREGYQVLGDDLNSWTQGGCWVLAEAIKKWVGPRAALYCVRGTQNFVYESTATAEEKRPIPHHVLARIGGYYLDADGIDLGPERVLNTWTYTEGLRDATVETFLPRYRKAALKLGIVCPPDAVKRVAAFLEKKFGPGEEAVAWMDGEEVRPNPKQPSPPLDMLYEERVLSEARAATKDMKLLGRETIARQYTLRIYTRPAGSGRAIAWLLYSGKELVGTGRLYCEPTFARAGIAVIAKPYRRQGLYAAMLPVLRKKLGVPIESDVSMTAGAIGAWKKAGGELTDRQGDKVFRINPSTLIPWWT